MIARFVGEADTIGNMLIEQGKPYNVEYIFQDSNGLLWFSISELGSQHDSIKLPYYSWSRFYTNWQQMEEVNDMKDWQYIPNWPEKHLTCTFCGTDKSVKYDVTVKDVNGKDCHVPACSKCVFRMTIDGK